MDAPRKKRRWRILIPVILVFVAQLCYMYLPLGPIKIQVSPETTVLDGPLNPDGTVNYVEALDRQAAEGVTADNNVVPVFLKVYETEMLPESPSLQTQALERLGMKASDLPASSLFVEWRDRRRTTPTGSKAPAAIEGAYDYDTEEKAKEINRDVGAAVGLLSQGHIHPDLEGWMKDNEPALGLLEEAIANRTRFYMPLVSPSNPPQMIDLLMPDILRYLKMAEAFSARARWRLYQGDLDGAWQDVRTLHRLARLVDQSPFIIGQLVAITIERMAADAGMALATSGKPDAARARRWMEEVAGLRPVGRVAETIDRSERFMTLDCFMMFSRGDIVKSGSLLPENDAKLKIL